MYVRTTRRCDCVILGTKPYWLARQAYACSGAIDRELYVQLGRATREEVYCTVLIRDPLSALIGHIY